MVRIQGVIKKIGLLGGASLAISSPALAATDSGFEVYGFAQVDFIQDFGRVNPAWQDAFRPSRIPVPEGQYGSDGQTSFNGKQTQFGVKASLPIEGDTLFTRFEFDFFGVGVDEGQTTPRFRHAYGQYGAWLGGQTNSLFMDGDIFPNIIEYWGPTGMVFLRTPQIRWTPMRGDSSLSIAIEKPGDDIDPGQIRELDPDIGANIKSDEKLPDLTAQWRTKGNWGHFQVAGILRQIGYETMGTVDNKPDGHTTGWGIDVTGTLKVSDRGMFLLGVVTGAGIANFMNDGGNDLGPDGTPGAITAKAIPLTGFSIYYNHSWNEKWTSAFGFSQTEVQNTDLQAATAYNRGQYASVNLLTTPYKNTMMGGEVIYGQRKNNDGQSDDDTRFQFSMKYNFSSKDF